MHMFNAGDIVKVLIPNVVNAGYDYRLTVPADVGQFVGVQVQGRPYVGVILGPGDGIVDAAKIKNVTDVFDRSMSRTDLNWILQMSAWTMMSPGAVLRLILNVPDAFGTPRAEQLYSFDFNATARMTANRLAVADAFAANDNDAMSAGDIQNIAHVSGAVVRAMIKNGTLVPVSVREKKSDQFNYQYVDAGNVILNDDQRAAADTIGAAIDAGGFSVHLIDGITGSGKTQVYFDAAWRVYSRGGAVLLMMPEIALTAQFMSRFAARFGAPPIVWHSNLTAARRRDIWRGVLRGDIRIVVGTRSALFLPWQNLGLVVVDEEHDTSYKQEDMGNYHARDMAVLRAKIAGFPIVLASATPSAETIENVSRGRYACVRLKSRFGGAALPTIETIDMRAVRPTEYGPDNTPGFLSPALCDMIGDTLAARQQVMLFINRRGFAPIVQCKKCGWVATCPDCSVGMTYHKRVDKLLCHMCGRTLPMPATCPDCGGAVSMRGAGLERIEAEIAARFPAARTALVSSDTISSRIALERLVDKMEHGDIDIVIGTQILAKGHHFPNLTLVGVVDADMGLFGTDFRAAEHTFQQLFQVAGRAGRGDAPGRVVLQTYQPSHPVLTAICAGNRDGFMAADMAGRRAAGMPPYGRLIALVIEGEREPALKSYCAALAAAAPNAAGVRIMGPIAAQLYQVRRVYRMRFLVVGGRTSDLAAVVRHWVGRVATPRNIRVKIDVDPMNFM